MLFAEARDLRRSGPLSPRRPLFVTRRALLAAGTSLAAMALATPGVGDLVGRRRRARGPRDALLGQRLDCGYRLAVGRGDQRDRRTAATRATGATDAVHVVVGVVRHIEVE